MKKKFLRSAVVLLGFMLCLFSGSVFAAGGNGSGNGGGGGNGGGQEEFLALESSSIQDGAKDVPTNGVIDLVFTKNVVNISVKDNNITAISLKDQENNPVEVTVEMGDDQIEPDSKNNIRVIPKGLEPGKNYTLVLGSGMMAKSGATLGTDINLSFTTLEAPEAVPINEVGSEKTATQDNKGNGNQIFIWIIVGLIAVVGVIFLVKKLNSGKK